MQKSRKELKNWVADRQREILKGETRAFTARALQQPYAEQDALFGPGN